MKNKILAPSMLAADFSQLGSDLQAMEKAGGEWLHVDIMDGHFVPNLTFGPDQMGMLKDKVNLPFDVHLMIEHPLEYVDRFIDNGADRISVHIETQDNIGECFALCDKRGIKKGLVLSPDTPVERVEPYLDDVDQIMIMSVYPGKGGQTYLEGSTEKIKELKDLIGDREILIEADGGINSKTIHEVSEAGCNVFVVGTAAFGENMAEKIKALKALM